MNLHECIRYVSKSWRATFEAPGYFDRPAAKMHLAAARQTIRELNDARALVKKLQIRLKSQAHKLKDAVSNADPMRSP